MSSNGLNRIKLNSNISYHDIQILQSALDQIIIPPEAVHDIEMKKQNRERVLSQHAYATFKDKDGRWKTTLYDETKKSKRRIIAKKNLEDLHEVLIQHYSNLEDNKSNENHAPTLASIYPEWLEYKNSQTNASSYARRINADWLKYYKNSEIVTIPLINLTYLTLHKWAHDLVKHNNMTKKQYYNAAIIMRQCLDYACEPELGILQTNPFERVKIKNNLFERKAKPKSHTQVFQTSEQFKICETANLKSNKRPWCTTPLVILLNFHLGLRIGEICALKWSDIEDNCIHIHRMETRDYIIKSDKTIPNGYKIVSYTKSDAGDREVFLNSEAKKILHQIRITNLKYEYYDDDFIFISSNGHRGTTRTLTKYLTDLCMVAGIINKSNHKIRKTYISSLFDSGVNINTIRELADHEDERTSLNNYCFDQNDQSDLEQLLDHSANKRMCV